MPLTDQSRVERIVHSVLQSQSGFGQLFFPSVEFIESITYKNGVGTFAPENCKEARDHMAREIVRFARLIDKELSDDR